MCVIMAAISERPTREEMEQGAAANPHGAGLAWIENGKVRFEKVGPGAAETKRIIDLAEVAPLPFVVHFRITSVGVTTPTLSHPFPLRHKNTDALEGEAKAVLFHNGTWREFKAPLMAAATATGVAVGDGPMSDTRAMAYLATVLGTGILSAVPDGNKMAVLRGDATVERFGTGWTEYAPGLWVSNTQWVPKAATRPAPTPVVASKPEPKKVEGKKDGKKPSLFGPTKAAAEADAKRRAEVRAKQVKAAENFKATPRLVKWVG